MQKLQFTERLGAQDAKFYTSIQEHPFFAELDFDTLHSQRVPLAEENPTADSPTSPLRLIKVVLIKIHTISFKKMVYVTSLML